MADTFTPPGSPDVNGVVRFHTPPASPHVVMLTPPASPSPRSEIIIVLETPPNSEELSMEDRPLSEAMVVPETPPSRQGKSPGGLERCRRRLEF